MRLDHITLKRIRYAGVNGNNTPITQRQCTTGIETVALQVDYEPNYEGRWTGPDKLRLVAVITTNATGAQDFSLSARREPKGDQERTSVRD